MRFGKLSRRCSNVTRLFETLNAALEGHQLPNDWLEANIRLLAKKEGHEHLFEFLLPGPNCTLGYHSLS